MNGIIGVVNTPFTQDNKIDSDSLRRYVDHSLKCGVVGFLVLGMAAEVNKLSLEEKLLIAETVVNHVNRKVPVIAGTSSQNQNDRVLLASELSKLGCDGILISIPFDDEDSFVNNVSEVALNISGFMMLQDWDFHGSGIPIHIIKKLFDNVENFKCLKIEVIPAGIKYSEVRKITDGKLHLSGGWASTQMIEALDRGVDAFMPTILHDVYNKIFQLHRIGKREEAKAVFEKMLPIISFSHQHLDISIHFNKRLVHRQGIFSTSKVREPILDFDKNHERVANELIDNAMELSKSITNCK
jgi:dihydrodipicolinate synthase/N-acetylneuraminate lyase